MKFSKEKIDEVKSQIRLYLAKNPKASAREIAETLGHNHKFIGWLKNEIHKELASSILNQNLKTEIGKFELLVEETSKPLWEIINNPTANNSERLNAIKCLVGNHSLLIDRKVESGFLPTNPLPEKKELSRLEIHARIKEIMILGRKIEESKKRIKEQNLIEGKENPIKENN